MKFKQMLNTIEKVWGNYSHHDIKDFKLSIKTKEDVTIEIEATTTIATIEEFEKENT